jgi:hypothetical protein
MANTRNNIKPRYARAYEELKSKRLDLEDNMATLSAFVKFEKWAQGKVDVGKPPRIIMRRSYQYLYLLKASLLDYSLKIKSNDPVILGQPMTTVLTKIHDNYGIAKVLRDHWDHFKNPIAVCLDHSKFDGHYSDDLLKIEHKFWKIISKNNQLLQRLLALQLKQRGYTANGFKYKVKGKRASGEYTTSDGNSLLNYAMLRSWLNESGVYGRICVNGDDSVIFIEQSDYCKLQPLSYFNNFNMETEMDIAATHFQMISYCQAKPLRVRIDGELVWYMVKDYQRTLSRMSICDIKFQRCIDRYMAGTLLCELACSSGIPIMQKICTSLLEGVRTNPLACVDRTSAAVSGNLIKVKPVDPVTRSDFEIAFGLDFNNQVRIENSLADAPISKNLYSYIEKYTNFNQIKIKL